MASLGDLLIEALRVRAAVSALQADAQCSHMSGRLWTVEQGCLMDPPPRLSALVDVGRSAVRLHEAPGRRYPFVMPHRATAFPEARYTDHRVHRASRSSGDCFRRISYG